MMTVGRYISHGSLVTLTALLTAAAAGCSSRTDEPHPGDGPRYMAGIYVTVGGGVTGDMSRATPADGGYAPGTSVENYIDIAGGDFAIYIFDANDIYAGRIENVSISDAGSDGINKTYEVVGGVSERVVEAARSGCKVMMLANWRGEYPSLTVGRSDIAEAAEASEYSFVFGTDDKITTSTPIPMFGITNRIAPREFSEDAVTDLGRMHLLRAYAKVVVAQGEDSRTITGVSLTKANAGGYRGPLGVRHQDHYVHNSYALDYYSRASIPAGIRTVSDMPLRWDDALNCWYIYMPEFANLVTGKANSPRPQDERSRLAVTFLGNEETGTEPVTEYVDFKFYNVPDGLDPALLGRHFDVLRNNVYSYVIRKDKDLEISLDVQPYAEIKVRPAFGLDRDNDGNLIIKRYPDGSFDIVSKNDTITKDDDGDRIVRRFADKSLLCIQTVLKDYIHEDSEVNYTYVLEKDRPAGNMIILRERTAGGSYHGNDDIMDPTHLHGMDDRALFVLDKAGDFHYVTYDQDGNPSLSPLDSRGDTIVQANGFQFRMLPDNFMYRYIGTYLVIDKNGKEDLRDYRTGRSLDFNTLEPINAGRSSGGADGNDAIIRHLRQAHQQAMARLR